jgi:hypothetical protein
MAVGDRGFRPLLARGGLLGLLVAAPWGIAPAQELGPPGARKCTCRANGRSYELGERVCLEGPAGYRVAECRMAENVTSWVFGSEECDVSAMLGPARGRAGSAPMPVAGSPGTGKGGG